MNRPSTKYTFLPDKHYPSNIKIIRAFAKRVLYHLEHNLEGVQLPIANLKIMKTKNSAISNNTLKEKYGEDYKLTNDRTDGYQILTKAFFYTDAYSYMKKKSFVNADYFKLITYKPLRAIHYRLSLDNKWINLQNYDHKGTSIKMQKYFEGSE